MQSKREKNRREFGKEKNSKLNYAADIVTTPPRKNERIPDKNMHEFIVTHEHTHTYSPFVTLLLSLWAHQSLKNAYNASRQGDKDLGVSFVHSAQSAAIAFCLTLRPCENFPQSLDNGITICLRFSKNPKKWET